MTPTQRYFLACDAQEAMRRGNAPKAEKLIEDLIQDLAKESREALERERSGDPVSALFSGFANKYRTPKHA